MKATAIAAALAIATLAHGADYVARIVDGKEVDRRAIPCGVGEASILAPGRLTAANLAEGWRDVVPAKTENIKASHWETTATQRKQVVDAVYNAAELAAQAQAAADAKAAADAANAAAQAKAAAISAAVAAIDPAVFRDAEQQKAVKAIVDALKELRRIEA